MRWRTAGITIGIITLATVAFAQQGPPAKFPLSPIATPSSASKLQAKQIELLNSAVEEFASAYERFAEGRNNTRELLEANERVLAASREAFGAQDVRSNFATKHVALVTAIEQEIERRDVGVQDLRFAKQMRLAAEIQLLRLTESPPPVDPARPPEVPGFIPRPVAPMGPGTVPPVTPEAGPPPLRSGDLKPVDEDEFAKVKAKLLDFRTAFGSQQFFMSDDGRHAVFVEGREGPRYALWNLDKGKLVRYLSAEEGKETKEYKDDDDADHGATITFAKHRPLKFIISPDGKWIAGLIRIVTPVPAGLPMADGPRPKVLEEMPIWELESGRLVRTVTTTHHHPHTFFFVDKTHIATKAFGPGGVAIERIDVESGEVDYLMEPGGSEMYGNGLHAGSVAFMVGRGGPVMVDLETKEQTGFEAPPMGISRMAAERLWFDKDGKDLFVHKSGIIEVWDVASKSYKQEWRLVSDRSPFDIVAVASDKNLVARRLVKEKKLEFIDVGPGKVLSSIVFAARPELCGISHDATRIAIPTENSVLVVDFPKGLPEGEMSLEELKKKAGGELLR